MCKRAGVGIKPVQAAIRRNPECPGAIFQNAPNVIAAQACGIGWIVCVMRELFRFRIEAVETRAICPYPQNTRTVLVNHANAVVGNRHGIVRIVKIVRKLLTRLVVA